MTEAPSRPPGPGWEPVEPFPFTAARQMFTGGNRGGRLIDLRYFRRADDRTLPTSGARWTLPTSGARWTLAALARFGPEAEGAPGRAHGGGVLTVLDEAMGAAAWIQGLPVLTVRLQATFRKAVPIGVDLLVEMSIRRRRGRLIEVEGRLLGPEGLCAQAEGTFMKLEGERVREVFGIAPRP